MFKNEEKTKARMDRRGFLRTAGIRGFFSLRAGALAGRRLGFAGRSAPKEDAAEMSPNEDLMQEHSLLNRALLIYEEAVRRLEGRKALDPEILGRTARFIQHFIEQYHEKLEEEHVFSRFEKAGQQLDLVRVLREQHIAGRILTQSIISRSALPVFENPAERAKLVDAMRSFIRMYRPHETREGSVLFPAFRQLIPAKEFLELGDLFEGKEHELLGAEGFEGQVILISGLEKQLGIYELSQYTPKPTG